jgi:hypothetical protein
MPVLTHIKKVQLENQTVKEKVQTALGCTSLKYAEFQEEMGLAYLNQEFPNDKNTVALMAGNKIFWSWWINHWVKRDMAFLADTHGLNKRWCQQIYFTRNNPKSAYFSIYKYQLQKSYSVMIGSLIKVIHND